MERIFKWASPEEEGAIATRKVVFFHAWFSPGEEAGEMLMSRTLITQINQKLLNYF